MSVVGGCVTGGDGASPCRPFADRTTGILGAEYRECAGAIMTRLDSLDRYLAPVARGDTTHLREARDAYRKARRLIRDAGIDRDTRSRNDAVTQRWPSSAMRSFNVAAWSAAVQWGAAIGHPSPSAYEGGRRHYEQARRLHARSW